MTNENNVGLGVIGFGNFAMFAIQHFMQVKGVKLIGISGTHRQAADAAAKRYGAVHLDKIEDLVKDKDVDIIYIATPPFLHYEHVMMSLNAGKHVICEKPLAMNPEEADKMIQLANSKGLMLSVNLMQRYNPVYHSIKQIIDKKPLGDVLHGYFQNYASDEGLEPDHWFWDKAKSGGIFIEHSVHFFDMFEGWFGPGKVLCAQSIKRPGTNIEEQVHCTTEYPKGILFDQYHGFTQPGRMDRQEIRILFERGDITLYEWVPIKVRINAVLNEEDTKTIMDIFPEARIKVSEFYAGNYRKIRARHKDLDIYNKLVITHEQDETKYYVYGELVRSIMKDQLDWIRDKNHKRIITDVNGYNSLKMAYDAAMLAEKANLEKK